MNVLVGEYYYSWRGLDPSNTLCNFEPLLVLALADVGVFILHSSTVRNENLQ